jgi:hypothetical protein
MARARKRQIGEVAPRADQGPPPPENALPQFVSPLITLDHQVGAHVIHALKQDNTVAVLTTVMPGPGGTQVIASVGLDAALLGQVHELLEQAQSDQEAGVPCVGFHCFLPPQPDSPPGKDKADES